MNQNKKNQKPDQNDNRKRNITGFITLIVWALILVIAMNALFARTETAGSQEIMFSELIDLIQARLNGFKLLTRILLEADKDLPGVRQFPRPFR